MRKQIIGILGAILLTIMLGVGLTFSLAQSDDPCVEDPASCESDEAVHEPEKPVKKIAPAVVSQPSDNRFDADEGADTPQPQVVKAKPTPTPKFATPSFVADDPCVEDPLSCETEEIIDAIPVFKKIIGAQANETIEDQTNSAFDKNGNGISDAITTELGENPNVVDKNEVALRAALEVEKRELIKKGTPAVEAESIVEQKLRSAHAKNKVIAIRAVAEKKYKLAIDSNASDANSDGISDEVAIALGEDPHGAASSEKPSVEQKLYGVTQKSVQQKKCTLGIYSGYQLATEGSAILASCPSKNTEYTLYAIDKKGKEMPVATKQTADDNKMIFVVDKKFDAGIYLFQVRKNTSPAASWPFALAVAANKTEESAPILVKILTKSKVPLPVVHTIQGVPISTVQNVSIARDSDGKIHVRGISDVSTMVVGTFSSAIFSSAMLADVTTGSFDITSAVPLASGQHEVVIYAVRPEEGMQSAPVRINFTLVDTAQAAAGDTSAAVPGKIPLIVGGALLLVITVGAVTYAWKKH